MIVLLPLLWACVAPSPSPASDASGIGSTVSATSPVAAPAPPVLEPTHAWSHSFWGHYDSWTTEETADLIHRAEDLAVGPDGAAWIVANRHDFVARETVPVLIRAEPNGEPGPLHEVVLGGDAWFELGAATVDAEGAVVASGRSDRWVVTRLEASGEVRTEAPWGTVGALPSPQVGYIADTQLLSLDGGATVATGPTEGEQSVLVRFSAEGDLEYTVELPDGDRVWVLEPAADGQVLLAGIDDSATRVWWRLADPGTGALGERVELGTGPDWRYPLAARQDDSGDVTILVRRLEPSPTGAGWLALARWPAAVGEPQASEPEVSVLDAWLDDAWGAAPGPEGTFVVAGNDGAPLPSLCWVHVGSPDCVATVDLELPLESGWVESVEPGPDGSLYVLGGGYADAVTFRTWLSRVEVAVPPN